MQINDRFLRRSRCRSGRRRAPDRERDRSEPRQEQRHFEALALALDVAARTMRRRATRVRAALAGQARDLAKKRAGISVRWSTQAEPKGWR